MSGPWEVLIVPAVEPPFRVLFGERPPLEWRGFRLHITELGLAYVERVGTTNPSG